MLTLPTISSTAIPRKRMLQLLLVSSMSVVLAGCASFDGIQSQAKMRTTGTELGTANANWPALNWPTQLGGSDLQHLIDTALQNHPSLELAAARIAAAHAGIESAQANRKLSGDIGYDATYQRFTENGLIPPPLAGAYYTDNELALKVNYDLDFWGKHDAAIRASVSQEKAAAAELQSARLMLSSAIAQAWNQLAREYALRDLAHQQLDIRRQLEELTRKRIAAGLDNETDKQQAKLQISNLELEIARWDDAIALTRNQLAALAGQTPAYASSIPQPPAQALKQLDLPAQLSLDLLSRRPDIAASRWRVEASQGEIDAGKAQFYPNINLIGFVGLSSLDFSNFIKSSSLVDGIGPSIHLPFFETGRLRAQLKGKVANYDAAVATYNQTLLDALHDTADQLSSLRNLDAQFAQANAAANSAQKTLELATARRQAGTANALPVLQAQSNLLQQQQQVLDLQFHRADLQIKLIKALGGGFSDTQLTATNATQPSITSESAQ